MTACRTRCGVSQEKSLAKSSNGHGEISLEPTEFRFDITRRLVQEFGRMVTRRSTRSKLARRVKASALTSAIPVGYAAFLASVKQRIRHAQIRASVSVTRELIEMYWDLGRAIVERQERERWGSAVIERLASDLRSAFPGMRGLATRNFNYARSFFLAYSRASLVEIPKYLSETISSEILQQAVAELNGATVPDSIAQIPWGQNILLLEKVAHPALRIWYARKSFENGWSRETLWMQIESKLHRRASRARHISSFDHTLSADQSERARNILKDPYNFEFLAIAEQVRERDIESALIQHMRQFLLELGMGFMFAGSQYRLVVGGEDFYLDLLFYHHKLRCFVVIELKNSEFKPEYVGKMGFYLTAVDEQLKHAEDRPTIGLILCRSKNAVVAEYAMRQLKHPIGIAEYRLAGEMPAELASSLPSPDSLEAELRSIPQDDAIEIKPLPPRSPPAPRRARSRAMRRASRNR